MDSLRWLFAVLLAITVSQQVQAGDQLGIYQGNYADLGATPEAVALRLSNYDVLALSHVKTMGAADFPNPTTCADAGYPHMKELIKELRRLKPSIKIFGYVAATADAPVVTNCGNNYSGNPGPLNLAQWTCPEGMCSNFISWVETWIALELADPGARIDGFLLDLVGPQYLTPGTRDSVFSYVRAKGKNIMANTPLSWSNVDFAAKSPYFGEAGDFALVEGFFIPAGNPFSGGIDWAKAGADAAAQYQKYRNAGKNFRLAAMTTEGWGASLDCSSTRPLEAYATFTRYFEAGNVFGYTTADLGIITRNMTFCPNTHYAEQIRSQGIQGLVGQSHEPWW